MLIVKFTSRKLTLLFLQAAIGLPFLYAAIDGFINPSDWVGYLPSFLSRFASPGAMLVIISVYELVLALWVLSGWRFRIAGALAALTYAGITLSNLNLFLVTFRDVGLFLAAAALAVFPDNTEGGTPY